MLSLADDSYNYEQAFYIWLSERGTWTPRLIGQCYNLNAGFEDQLKMLNGLEIWNDLHN